MKRLLLAAVVLLVLAGCSSDPNHPFFKPELSGATYAVQASGDPTADDARDVTLDVKAVLEPKPFSVWGADPAFIDIGQRGLYEGWQFVDDGAFYCAPKIDRLAAPAPSAGDPTADD